jgi:cytochrome oxidase Cu insertion factor (SCO1/SenC/PrrC family)
MIRQATAPSLLMALVLGFLSAYAQQPAANQTRTLKVGDMAPDFTLPDQNGKPVRLSDFHGKQNVILAFYVLAFTGG